MRTNTRKDKCIYVKVESGDLVHDQAPVPPSAVSVWQYLFPVKAGIEERNRYGDCSFKQLIKSWSLFVSTQHVKRLQEDRSLSWIFAREIDAHAPKWQSLTKLKGVEVMWHDMTSCGITVFFRNLTSSYSSYICSKNPVFSADEVLITYLALHSAGFLIPLVEMP